MSSESADGVLSPPVSSIVASKKLWKLCDPIHSIGVGAVEEKKLKQTFGNDFATTRVEGVFFGYEGQKYRCEMDQSN